MQRYIYKHIHISKYKAMLNMSDDVILNLNGDTGLYFVRVQTGDKMEILKVIKE